MTHAMRRLLMAMALLAGPALGLMVGCNGSASIDKTPPPAPAVSSITAAPATMVLTVGDTSRIAVTAHLADATTAAVTSGVAFACDAPAVATVDAATGLVTAVGAGTATLSATYQGKSATVHLTVSTPGTPAPTTLFMDPGLTYSNSQTPINSLVMIQDLGNPNATGLTTSTSLPATGSFASYPSWWDGGIAWATVPTGGTGYYDLSHVAKIRFKIKSAWILPTQLAFFIQWKSATSGYGNEYTLPLQLSSAITDPSGAKADLGVTSIQDWTTVTVDLASAIPDVSDQPTRYGFSAEPFFTGDGSTHVDTPIAIKWYGSAGTDPNTGPIGAGFYQIGDIQFLDASGADVPVAAGLSVPTVATAPSTLPAAPTLPAANAISLYTSSGTYTNIPGITWNPNWGQASSIVDATVGTGTVKLLTMASNGAYYQGVDFAGNPQDISSKPILHLSYWTPDGQDLSVTVITGQTEVPVSLGSLTQHGWVDAEVDFSAVPGISNIIQLKFTSNTAGTYYLDNIYFHAPSVPSAPPSAPALSAALVQSLYNTSGTYVDYGIGDWNPNWGQGGAISDYAVGGKNLKLMNLVNYQGVDISGPYGASTDTAPAPMDATGQTYLHISYWTPNATVLSVDVINATSETWHTTGAVKTFTGLTQFAWTDLEIPMPAGFDMSTLRQIKFTNETNAESNVFGNPVAIYMDNIYFHH